ncbi:MAG TPA: hypothetical protein VMQ67_08260, partial [Candidatus Saccharimonadales bacterium]|nr:hypothetical protein [Candidatus Saccharimonadales bacterium]
MASVFPEQGRGAWIMTQRPARTSAPDPNKPSAFFLEEERMESSQIVRSGVIFLTNKECPWRCLMCDLWKNTTSGTVPAGAIPGQIDFALRTWGEGGGDLQQIKLYNSGSFFDSAAIPPGDYPTIARKMDFAKHVL